MQVSMAQQYNLTLTGHPDLRHWLRQHVMDQHQAPGEHDTYVSSGTNHALEVRPALCLPQLYWHSIQGMTAAQKLCLRQPLLASQSDTTWYKTSEKSSGKHHDGLGICAKGFIHR